MDTGRGLLAVWMEPKPENDADLNRWYREEHLPERLGVPGFISAIRYRSLKGSPKYMALYDIDAPEVLKSEPYREAQRNATPWTRSTVGNLQASARREYELIQSIGDALATPSEYVLAVRYEADPENSAAIAQLNEIKEKEQLPALAKVPGVLRLRRYRIADGSPKYFDYCELASADVIESDAWKQAEASAKLGPLLRNVEVNVGQFIEAGKRP